MLGDGLPASSLTDGGFERLCLHIDRIAAEGVRSYDDLERLLAEGVDLVQGSYICPPMTHDSIVRTRLLSRP